MTDPFASTFALLDRQTERRGPEAVARALHDPAALVLDIDDGNVPVEAQPDGRMTVTLRPVDAGDQDLVFLGATPAAQPVFMRMMRAGERELAPSPWAGLRDIGLRIDPLEREILTTAVALSAWHRSHPNCPRCGTPTEIVSGGWVRRCPRDGSEHYPRTDPAIIVLVQDDHERALLAHQTRWPAGWMSTLAGFVEPGESAEAAVRREVAEEVGVEVTTVAYAASQPWPFPASLMLGFHARAVGADPEPDGVEIDKAAWFTRDELRSDAAAGDVLLPPGISIAHRLITDWFGEPLPSDWSRPTGSGAR